MLWTHLHGEGGKEGDYRCPFEGSSIVQDLDPAIQPNCVPGIVLIGIYMWRIDYVADCLFELGLYFHGGTRHSGEAINLMVGIDFDPEN